MAEATGDRTKVVELVGRAQSAMLTTTGLDGAQVSRPMAVQETEFDGDLWFFVDDRSEKVAQIHADPRVNVSFSNDKQSEWTSIAGTAELVRDRQKAEELWSKPLETWFPDGLETAGLALLKVHTDSAEYWDASNSMVKQALGMARAIRKDDPEEFPVEHRTVDL